MLRCDDIARAHWQRRALPATARAVLTFWRFLVRGAIGRMYSLAHHPVYAALSSIGLTALALVVAALAGWATASMLSRSSASPGLAVGVAGLATLGLFLLGVQTIHRLQMTWFPQLAAFTFAQARGRVDRLDERLARFAQRIVEVAVRPDLDELLIVAHSVGANVAATALARALALDPQLASRGPTVSLLTLGHATPLLATLPEAQAFRDDLAAVARSAIDWVDVSSPIDWAAFALVDPLAGFREPAATADWHPRLASPRFHRLFTPQRYAQLKRRRFQVHLQYLLAAESPGMYDYFAITAGRQTLRERFESGHDGDAA
jgi:hypothetical protein